MADRGDVVQLKHRLGFESGSDGERFVVVQASSLAGVLPTVIAVPLDPQVATFGKSPLVVRVTAREAGARSDHVAVACWVQVIATDRLAPGRVGAVNDSTMLALDDVLRRVLDL